MSESNQHATVPLHSTTRGQGASMVLLHGLFGSISNLRTLARGLETRYRITCFDLRNHGSSGHSPSMHYEEMAADVLTHIRQQNVPEPIILIGHSMGGKVAMSCTLLQQSLPISALVVLDIAPVDYGRDLMNLVRAMTALEGRLQEGRSRVDALLAEDISDPLLRSFLMKNLVRDGQGGFRWRLNLRAIEQNIAMIRGFPEKTQGKLYGGPTLFLGGTHSDYLHDEHHTTLFQHFPNARIAFISDAGHWLHAQQPVAVLEQIEQFLNTLPAASTAE